MKLLGSLALALLAASCNGEVPDYLSKGSRFVVKAFDSPEKTPQVFKSGATLEQLQSAAGKNAIVESAEEVEEGVYSVDVQRVRQDWAPYAKPQFLKKVHADWLLAVGGGKAPVADDEDSDDEETDKKPKPSRKPKPSKKDDDDGDKPGRFFEKKAPWNGVILVFWDTETTGLNVWTEDVIQLSAVAKIYNPTSHAWEDFYSASRTEFDMYIKTDKKLSPKIVEITGITDEKLAKDGRPFPEVYEAFRDFLNDLRAAQSEPIWMVAHNGHTYDNKIFMANERRRMKKETGTLFHDVDVHAFVDTLMLSRYFYKQNGGEGRGKHTLSHLYEQAFGETFPAHSSLEDSRALARLMTAEPFQSALDEFPLGCNIDTYMEDFNEKKANNDNKPKFSATQSLTSFAKKIEKKIEERGWIFTPIDQQEVLIA